MRTLSVLGLLLLVGLPARLTAQISIHGNGIEEYQARPGETYSGTIRVKNQGSQAAEARVYLTDYTFSADGTTQYGEPGALPRSSAAWIRFTPAQVHLAAGAEATVGYSVTVPQRLEAGTYWSMLMVEAVSRPDVGPTARRNARVAMSMGASLRYGVQLATTILGAAPSASFAGTRAVATTRSRHVEFDLVNSGAVAYRPRLRLELYDAAGALVGTYAAERGLLYPGTSLHQVFALGSTPSGSYHALLTADTGGDEVFGAQYQLRL